MVGTFLIGSRSVSTIDIYERLDGEDKVNGSKEEKNQLP